MAQSVPDRKILRENWLRNFAPTDVFNRVRAAQFTSPGMFIVVGIPMFTVFLWLYYARHDGLPLPVFLTKVSAFSALALLSLNHVLSLRTRFLEKLFRGLDRMYRVHHVVGQTAFLLIVAHPILLLVARKDSWPMVLDLTVPGRDFGITLGMVSLYLLLALLFVTFSLRVRYHKWHLSHHIMVVPLFIAFLHAVASGTYVRGYPVLRYWLVLLCTLGIASYVYTMFFYRHAGPVHNGRVVGVQDMEDIVEVRFRLDGHQMSFKAGQFVFIRFLSLDQSYETFPFSLSGAPGEEVLRISAKKSGDFTRHILPGLNEGDRILVWGPYGAFGEHYHHRNDDSIWIAGGIGATPFLSMVQDETGSKRDKKRRILFVWVCNSEAEAVYNDEILGAIEGNSRIRYVLWTSSSMGRITAEDILRLSSKHIVRRSAPGTGIVKKDLDIFICGPPPMMAALSHQFLDKGFKANSIFFEDFSLL